MSVFVPSIDISHSVGIMGENDHPFSDLMRLGGFPITQKIEKITEITVYANSSSGDVVEGITVRYLIDGKDKPISHGIVKGAGVAQHNVNIPVGSILVGVYGVQNTAKRIASISFVIFNTTTATTTSHGPFGCVNDTSLPYATFGPIIAFNGTQDPDAGLTSLGFCKTNVQDYVVGTARI